MSKFEVASKIIAIHTVQFTIYRINKEIFIIFVGLK